MARVRKTIFVILSALWAAACVGGAKSGPPSATPGPTPLAPRPSQEGGTSSGGGNVPPSVPASRAQIRAAIAKAQVWLPYIFNRIEFLDYPDLSMGKSVSRNDTKHRVRFNKLFGKIGEEAPIRRELKRLRVEPAESGPCQSKVGREMGAAFSDGRVCLSLEMLEQDKDVTDQNVFVEVAALLAREASHLATLEEDESKVIQELVRSDLRETVFLQEPSEAIWILRLTIDPIVEGAAAAIAVADDRGSGQDSLCVALGALPAQIQALKDAGHGRLESVLGVALLSRPRFYYFYDALTAKASLAIGQECTSGSAARKRLNLDRIFGRDSRVTIREALHRLTDSGDSAFVNGRSYPIEDVLARRFDPGDRKSLIEELAELKALATRMSEAIGE